MHKIDTMEALEENRQDCEIRIEKYKPQTKQKFQFIGFLYWGALKVLRLQRAFQQNVSPEKGYLKLALYAIADVSRLSHFVDQKIEAHTTKPCPTGLSIMFINLTITGAIKCLFGGRKAGFSGNLAPTLQAHESWRSPHQLGTHGGPPPNLQNMGGISFPCATLAARTRDRGWDVAIKSGYMTNSGVAPC